MNSCRFVVWRESQSTFQRCKERSLAREFENIALSNNSAGSLRAWVAWSFCPLLQREMHTLSFPQVPVFHASPQAGHSSVFCDQSVQATDVTLEVTGTFAGSSVASTPQLPCPSSAVCQCTRRGLSEPGLWFIHPLCSVLKTVRCAAMFRVRRSGCAIPLVCFPLQ